MPSGQHCFVPLTIGRTRPSSGKTAEADLVNPVRELACTRMHDEALLAWEWPRGATEAVISWAGGGQRCARHVYDDEGGAKVTIGPGETLIEVRALYGHRSGWLTAPPVAKVVPARGAAVGTGSTASACTAAGGGPWSSRRACRAGRRPS